MNTINTARALALLSLVALAACKEEKKRDPRAILPDLACPGGPSCPDTGEERLLAGAAKVAITPTIVDTVDDVNGNGDFEPPPMGEDVWHDNNGNGKWDFVWIAGYGMARPANDVHDDLWARTLVLRWKSTTVAIVAVDLVGLFSTDIDLVREEVAGRGVDVDFLSVSATHTHEGPDTMGIWGFDEVTPGFDQAYIDSVIDRIADSVEQAAGALQPAKVSYGSTVPAHDENGVCNVVMDGRDPFIIEETLTTLRFTAAADGATIATIVNWAGHAEAAGDENHSITSDYPHYLREGIENGLHRGATSVDGVGGIALFVTGPVGCQIGSFGDFTCRDLEGNDWPGYSFGKTQCVGENLALHALRAIGAGTPPEEACPIEVRAKKVEITIQNYGYHTMVMNNVFHRTAHGYDTTKPITDANLPRVWTEVSWIRIGRAQLLGLPGELSPELAIGGYKGEHTPQCAFDHGMDRTTLGRPGNPNPPDLSAAPPGPYLFDFLAGKGAEYPMIWGLTNDEIGYFVPPYDYKLAEAGAYIQEAPGDHYEETNSAGPDTWPEIEKNVVGILLYE